MYFRKYFQDIRTIFSEFFELQESILKLNDGLALVLQPVSICYIATITYNRHKYKNYKNKIYLPKSKINNCSSFVTAAR